MARLTHIDVRDSAKLFAVTYGALGAIAAGRFKMAGLDAVSVPIGFNLGPLSVAINLNFTGLNSGTYSIVFIPLFYAITGAITGLILGLAFNLVGNGLYIRVQTEGAHGVSAGSGN